MSFQPIDGLTPREQKKLEKMMMKELLQQQKNFNREAKHKKKIKKKKKSCEDAKSRNREESIGGNLSEEFHISKEASKKEEEQSNSVEKIESKQREKKQENAQCEIAKNSEMHEQKQGQKIGIKHESQPVVQENQSSQEQNLDKSQNILSPKQKQSNLYLSQQKDETNQKKFINPNYNMGEMEFFEYIMSYSYTSREKKVQNPDEEAIQIERVKSIQGHPLQKHNHNSIHTLYESIQQMKRISNTEPVNFSDNGYRGLLKSIVELCNMNV